VEASGFEEGARSVTFTWPRSAAAEHKITGDVACPRRFFRAGECMAVVPIPSLTSREAFDSG
jgi:hypothetical protein